jgi:hypothetical protein
MAVPRRTVIVGLVVVGVIAVGFVAAALANPWRLTVLYPLAHEGLALGVLVLGGALVAGAVLLRLSGGSTVAWRTKRAVLALIVALVAIAALCVVLPVLALGSRFRQDAGSQTLALSPDGAFSAVKSTVDTDAGPRTRIYIRSRAGLFSRESETPAAVCGFDPFARGVPPESVRFTGHDTLAIPIADMPTTVVHFNPTTLSPDHTILMCQTGP